MSGNIDLLHLANLLGLEKVKGNSNRIVACCGWPDHSDAHPSFNMWESGGVYTANCYSCGRSANIVSFCKEVGNQTAFEYVLDCLGLDKDTYKDDRPSVRSFKNGRAFNVDNARKEMKNYKEAKLEPDINIVENWLKHCPLYILKRLNYNGLSQKEIMSVIKKHSIGMDSKGFEHKSKKFDGTFKITNMWPRAVFIIRNSTGDIVGWSGRKLDNSKGFPPKFFLSPNFKKENYFYGENLLNYNRTYAIVVEGLMSVVQWDVFGYENVVAVLGSGISDIQVKRLSQNFEYIIYVHDNDKAGRNSAIVVREKLGNKAVIVENNYVFPQGHIMAGKGKDPSDFTPEETEEHMMKCEEIIKKMGT